MIRHRRKARARFGLQKGAARLRAKLIGESDGTARADADRILRRDNEGNEVWLRVYYVNLHKAMKERNRDGGK